MKINSALFCRTFSASSLTLAFLLSSAYAMTGGQEWETDPEPSYKERSSPGQLSPGEKKTIGAALVNPAPLSCANTDPQTVGRIKVPSSLQAFFGMNDENLETYIAVPHPAVPLAQERALSTPHHQQLLPSLAFEPSTQGHATQRKDSSFEVRLEDVSLRENTLKSMGIPVTDDNLASYFLAPEELYERLANNFHGPELNHDKADFRHPRSLPIFDGLRQTKSIKVLSLKGAFLTTQSYLALATTLAYNRSLIRLDLRDASFTEEALFILGYGLQSQSCLQEILLKPHDAIEPEQLERFYNSIATNTGLRLIIWPEDDKLLKKLRTLSDGKNAPAVLHRGVMYAEGINEPQDTKNALFYLKQAYELHHPLSAYEIARLYKKQGNVDEALTWYRKAADQGHAQAQAKLGDYYRGIWPKGSLKEADYEAAYRHYKKAADQNDAKGFYRLGRMYEGGRFVEKDLAKAADLFYQAVEYGYPDAFTALGALYHNPDYAGHNPAAGQYYLTWGKRFAKTKGTAQRLLSSVEKGQGQ